MCHTMIKAGGEEHIQEILHGRMTESESLVFMEEVLGPRTQPT